MQGPSSAFRIAESLVLRQPTIRLRQVPQKTKALVAASAKPAERQPSSGVGTPTDAASAFGSPTSCTASAIASSISTRLAAGSGPDDMQAVRDSVY